MNQTSEGHLTFEGHTPVLGYFLLSVFKMFWFNHFIMNLMSYLDHHVLFTNDFCANLFFNYLLTFI